jgi:hypothetical protein
MSKKQGAALLFELLGVGHDVATSECIDRKGAHISLDWLMEIFEDRHTKTLNLKSALGILYPVGGKYIFLICIFNLIGIGVCNMCFYLCVFFRLGLWNSSSVYIDMLSTPTIPSTYHALRGSFMARSISYKTMTNPSLIVQRSIT